MSKGMELIPFQCFAFMELVLLVITLAFIQLPIVCSYSPVLLGYFLVDSLFSFLTSRKISNSRYEMTQQLTRKQRKADYFGGLFTEKSSAKEMRVFGAQTFFFQKWRDNFRELNELKCENERKIQKAQMLGNLLSFLIQAGFLAGLFVLLLNGRIDIASFAFLYTFIPAVSGQFKSLVQTSLGDLYENFLNIRHYVEYVDGKEQINSGEKQALTGFESLKIENVSYSYPTAEKYAVKDISLSIQKNEVVAILGYNGSGKSTLCRLMTGMLAPEKGTIKINGKEISAYKKEDVFKLFGIANQDFTR